MLQNKLSKKVIRKIITTNIFTANIFDDFHWGSFISYVRKIFLPPNARNYVCASGCKKYTLEPEQQELISPCHSETSFTLRERDKQIFFKSKRF